MSAEVLLQASGVSRRYPAPDGTITAVDTASMTVTRGDFVVIQGPSGCGKSTLLCLLGLLDRPDEGEVEILGKTTSLLSDDARASIRRRSVGYLFQDAGLIERMSVRDNVALPLQYLGVSRGEQIDLVDQALGRVGLSDRAVSSVGQLSGGQRQRVGFARALVSDPPLVLCDEPTASLDADNGNAIVDLLASCAAAGAAVICSSHDAIVTQRAGALFSMERGKLTAVARNPAG